MVTVQLNNATAMTPGRAKDHVYTLPINMKHANELTNKRVYTCKYYGLFHIRSVGHQEQ